MIQRLTKLPTPFFLVGAFVVGFWLMLQSRAALIFLMALYGAIFTMVGCGEHVEFETKHGIHVVVDEEFGTDFGDDVYDVDIYNKAFDIIFRVAGTRLNRKESNLVDRAVDAGFTVRPTRADLYLGARDVLAYYNIDNIKMENAAPGDLRILAHEMCHVFAGMFYDQKGYDYYHENTDYFGEEDSIERDAKLLIYRELTGLEDYR